MRIARMLALFALVVAQSAAAQTFDQLGLLRLPDATPRTARATALGGVSDPLGDDFILNPATAASIREPMLLVQGARASNGIVVYGRTADDALSIDSRWMSRNQLTLFAGAAPVGPVVIAAYYAADPRLVGPDVGANTTATTPYAPAECPGGCRYLWPTSTLALEREQTRYGIAAAWERGTLAIGAGLELQRLRETSSVDRNAIAPTVPLEQIVQQDRLFRRIDDRAVVPNVGIRWRVTPRVALAAAYNGAGTFERSTSACTVAGFNFTDCTTAIAPLADSHLRMPDAYRAAAAWDVTDRLRAIGEVVRRNYSSLADDDSMPAGQVAFPYRNVTELHAGVEYRLAALPLVLRAGWWRDPSRIDLQPTLLADPLRHYTAGAGLRLGKSTNIDIAYDHSDDPVSRSVVVGLRFH